MNCRGRWLFDGLLLRAFLALLGFGIQLRVFSLSNFTASTTLTLVGTLFRFHVLQRFLECRRHLAVAFGDLDHSLRLPVLFVSQHGPCDDSDLSRQRNGGLLFACFLLAADSFVDPFRPRVVSERCPGTLDEDGASEWIASLGDPSVAIRFAGLVLAWNKSEVGRHLSAGLKAVWVIETSDEDFGSSRSNAGDGSQSSNSIVMFADPFKLLDHCADLLGQRIEDGQLDIQFSFPEFIRLALGNRFTERVDVFTSGVPSLFATVDLNAMIDEQGSNGVLGFVDSTVECLAVLHECSELAMLERRHMDGLELFHGCHACQLEGIVLVGFSFDIRPSPCFFVGGTDERVVTTCSSDIIDPSRGSARFHDDQVRVTIFEDVLQVLSCGGASHELGLSRFGVKKATNRVELSEVKGENLHGE